MRECVICGVHIHLQVQHVLQKPATFHWPGNLQVLAKRMSTLAGIPKHTVDTLFLPGCLIHGQSLSPVCSLTLMNCDTPQLETSCSMAVGYLALSWGTTSKIAPSWAAGHCFAYLVSIILSSQIIIHPCTEQDHRASQPFADSYHLPHNAGKDGIDRVASASVKQQCRQP